MKYALSLASLLAALAVAMGAIGAHMLPIDTTVREKSMFETAVLYHFFHSFALLFVYILHSQNVLTLAKAKILSVTFLSGLVLFSFSIYGIVLFQLTYLSKVTPIGGMFFIASWLLLAVFSIVKSESL